MFLYCMFNIQGAVKWDAWNSRRGMNRMFGFEMFYEKVEMLKNENHPPYEHEDEHVEHPRAVEVSVCEDKHDEDEHPKPKPICGADSGCKICEEWKQIYFLKDE